MNIVLISENPFKQAEFKEIFRGYGINLSINQKLNIDINGMLNKEEANAFLDEINEDFCFILREETHLEDLKGNLVKEHSHLQVLNHVSELNVYYVSRTREARSRYYGKVKGFMDYSKKALNEEVYNWDDIFVCSKTMLTYFEMKGHAGKHSARTQVIAEFLNDQTFYDDKIDLNHNPLNQEQVVEFDNKIYDLIQDNKYLSAYKDSDILTPLMNQVLRNGLFTRSASNRKQRNYWFPVFNAGLPLTPKKDEIHETTFMFHDLMHHVIPDLIIDQLSSELDKDSYIIHRMMSEAITIVLADMVYIDILAKNGIDYDWSKRKIYPVYQAMNINNLTPAILKEILWANINFALLGDDSKLITLSEESAVQDYTAVYEKFFIEDYRWTINNFNAMSSNAETLRQWFDAIKYFVPKDRKLSTYSSELNSSMSYNEKVKAVFDRVWIQIESMLEDRNPAPPAEESISNAFKNYMIGQSYIFFDYGTLPQSNLFFNKIKNNFILNDKLQGGKYVTNHLSQSEIQRCREFFGLYIDILEDENRLNSNLSKLYKEIVPVFEPFYVFYDSQLKHKSIKDVLEKEVLS